MRFMSGTRRKILSVGRSEYDPHVAEARDGSHRMYSCFRVAFGRASEKSRTNGNHAIQLQRKALEAAIGTGRTRGR